MALRASLVIAGDAAAATAALGQVDAALDKNAAAAKRAGAANDEMGHRVERGSRQAQAGYVNLGRQIQDVTIQAQSGTNLGTIIAQQGGQIADAVAQMGGRFSGLASFLAGPWGAAVIVGTSLLANMVQGLWSAGDAAEQSSKKQLTLHDALQKAAFGSEEARMALAEYRAEQDRASKSTESMIKLNLASAEARLKDALATRQQLAAELAKRLGTAKDVASLGEDPSGSLQLAQLTRDKLNYLQNGKDNDSSIALIQATIRNLRVQDAVRDASGAADPLKAINNRYDDMAEAAKRAARGNDALAASLKGTLVQIERQRAADLKSQRHTSRSGALGSGLSGQEIDAGAAASIARNAGFRPTSGVRSIAEQKWLYENRRTPTNPVAFPDANAPHVRGNALDIAFGAGVTPEKIRKAYAEQGVRLTKLLKEDGHFHIEWSTSGADKIQREAEQLAKWGQDVAARIAGVTDQFSDMPPAVARANAATRDLDKTIVELTERTPPGFEKMIEDATALKGVIADSLNKPFNDYLEQARQATAIDQLLIAGKRDQAAAMQVALQIQRAQGPLTEQQLDAIQRTVIAERERGEMLQRQQEMVGNYLDATRSVRAETEGILSGTGKLSNLPQIFKNLQGKVLAEKLFGSMFRDLDKWVQNDSGLRDATSSYVKSTNATAGAALDLAATFRAAGGQIRAAAMGGTGSTALDALIDPRKPALAPDPDEIRVTATLPVKSGSLLDVTVDEYIRKTTQSTAKSLTDALDATFGSQFFGNFSAAIAGAMEGYVVGGGSKVGVGVGIAKGLFDEFGPKLLGNAGKGISDKLDGALKGVATGSQVAGLAGAFGIKLNQTGAQIGGAIGSFLPIPGGQIIGSIAGGLLGNVFGKRPRGAASVTNSGVSGSTNDASLTQSILGQGGDLQGAINALADKLGATVGSYDVGLGRYKDYYQVSSSASDPRLGNAYFSRDSRNSLYDGTDPAKATAAALAEAIRDGAIQGVSAKVSKALSSNIDIEKALAEALKVQQLEEMLGGISGTIEKAFSSFENQAKERLRIATNYGFDIVKIEELNARERLNLSKKLLEEQVGSLQRLVDDMTGGSLFEGSAVDKRAAILDQIAKARSETDAGTPGAADKLAGLLEQLNAVSKEVYGTTGGFAADRTAILDQARDAIARANQRIAEAQTKSDPALVQTNAALDENNDQNAKMIALLENIGAAVPTIPVSMGGFDSLSRVASTKAF